MTFFFITNCCVFLTALACNFLFGTFPRQVFLTWIYGQLSNMLKELKDLNETYKYKMFRGLAWTLGTFATLFTTLTVAMLAAEGSQTQSWEWKFEWINVVSWEVRKAIIDDR